MTGIVEIERQLRDIRLALEKINARLGAKGAKPSAFGLREAGEEIGLGLTTLKELIRKRVILTVLVGRRRLVPLSEIERFLQVSPDERTRKVRRKSEGEKYRAELRALGR